MTSPSETAADHQMAAGDDALMRERIPGPAGSLLTGNPQPASAGAWHPGATAADSPAEEPEVTGRGDAERPMTLTVPDAEPESVPESSTVSATGNMSTRWHEIQAMFIDDPRASAESAAALVDESVQALVASVKEQQDSLLAAWHGEDAGTEELRTAVRHYRAFGNRLADFSREARAPGATRQ
jgi:hypothetical protein